MTEFQFSIITFCCYQWYAANYESLELLFMKVLILFSVLRNQFWANKFRNYYEVTHSNRSKGILSCQDICSLHFVKFSTLETTRRIVYGQITKILTDWKIVKWPLLFLRSRPKRSVFTFLCKNLRRIVWNGFRSWGRLVWQWKGRFSRNFYQKSHFWHVIKSQKIFWP